MSIFGSVVRLVILLVAILIATWISREIRTSLDMMVLPENQIALNRPIMLVTGIYIVLLAIPFVPGAEIGLTMLTMFGAPIAPLVYCATVAGLMLSYMVGRHLPVDILVPGLRLVHLNRAATLVEETATLPNEARLNRLMSGGSPRMLRLAARYRYLAILLAINLPGNFLIGGGGGISLLAGMSGLFAPVPFFLTVAVAVCPIPLAILLFGA